MDTVKSNQDNENVDNNERRNIILQKKQRLMQMKEFLNLKIRIHQLINLKRLDEAKESYQSLYIIYESLLKNSNERESTKLKTDISTIYSKLINAPKIKTVKKGTLIETTKSEENPNTRKNKAKKVITTDLDVIIKIVEEKGKMSLSEIESTFNISRRLAEEWVHILSDYGLVQIRYLPVGGVEIVRISKENV